MTPAINLLQAKNIRFDIHEYAHDPAHPSYGLEAAEKLGVAVAQVFKTLVVQTDSGTLAIAIIPVNEKLSFKKMAKACQCKKIAMAKAEDVIRATGYVLGGVSPLAQKKRHMTRLHKSAADYETIYLSAGRRGLEVSLSAADLLLLTNGIYSALTD